MKTVIKNSGLLLGRFLLALIFLIAGISKVIDFEGSVHYLSAEGVGFAELLIGLAIFFEICGSLMIMFGWKTRYGAFMLFAFTLIVTLVFHDFWTYGAIEVENQMQHFLKNLALMGGTLYIMIAGAGLYSFDGKKTLLRPKAS